LKKLKVARVFASLPAEPVGRGTTRKVVEGSLPWIARFGSVTAQA
jgi:hypothetical protein